MCRKLVSAWLVCCLIVVNGTVFAQAKAKATQAPKAQAPAKPAPAGDLVLGRLAAEKSLFTLMSNGWKAPAANTRNKTEKLWAEKSLQDFIQKLTDEIKKSVEHHAGADKTAVTMAANAPVFLCAAIQHPMSLSVVSFAADPNPQVNASLVIDTESDEAKVRQALENMIQVIPKADPPPLIEVTIEGAKFYQPQVPEAEMERVAGVIPRFGMYKSFFVFTMGEDATAETIKKLTGADKAPAWFDATLRDLKVDRPSVVWQVNVEAIIDIVDPMIEDENVRTVLEATGLLDIKRVAAVSGLDAVGSASKLIVETSTTPTGILALLPDKPLSGSDLKFIPAKPDNAHIVRFDLPQFVEGILKIADQVSPMARQQFDMVNVQGQAFLGFSIQDDLLPAFGDVWSVYATTNETDEDVPNVIITASIQDQKKLIKVQDSLVRIAKQFLPQIAPQVELEEFTVAETNGYQVELNNPAVQLVPSWVITKDQFVLGLNPEAVTAHCTANRKSSLADNEDVKTALKRDPKAVMLSYRDPKPEIQGVYKVVETMSPFLLGLLQQQGIEFELPPLPPIADIEQHLAPSVATLARTPNGWRSESHGVVPSLTSATPATAAVLVALLLPAVQQAREAARRTQAKNNLKQIGLAMFNFHDTYQHFPERVTLDSKDKPGLSWRVKILPFLDEKALYDEFHLDEPWDSEHNKTLIERMPMTFASPNDPEQSAKGETRYVVPVGEGYLFDGDEGPKIGDVTDGTSSTIMVLEARSDHAVIWTKPDDLDIDMDDILAGLKSARSGGFHALFSDGAVRFISDNINLDILRALFTKAGGEIIGDF